METLGYIALLFVGLMLGTFGGGGAILSVPILVYLFSLDAVTSTAYSLFIVGNDQLGRLCIKTSEPNGRYPYCGIIRNPLLGSNFFHQELDCPQHSGGVVFY
jgi:hypothetical protein